MGVLLELTQLRVRSLDVDFNEVSWQLCETSEDVLDYTFQVQRSESPNGPWDVLSVPFQDQYLFLDKTVLTGDRWRKYFYQIMVVQVPTGATKTFGPVAQEPDADLIATELRRHMQLLFREFAGRRCWVLPVRTFGQRCFLPGTVMEGAVISASRAWYEGKTVQVRTAKGFVLTVTANHPVLTAQGLTAAQSVRVGDYLVCDGLEPRISAAAPRPQRNEQQKPALAEDVFRALAERTHSQTTRAIGLDFHGEAQHFIGDVEVVGAYCDLLADRQTALSEQYGKGVLEQTAPGETFGGGLCSEHTLLKRLQSTSGRIVSSSGLSPFSSEIGSGPSVVLRLGLSAQLDSPLLQCTAEAFSRNTSLAGQLEKCSAGLVALDEVVDIRIKDYRGHVFDFQTLNGWIIADGIVTSNCTCWNATLRKRTRSGCKLCWDTGFVRGYLHPIESWIQVDPSPKTKQFTNVGAQEQSNTTMRLVWYPPLKPDDLIVEPENRRWKVVQVNQTEQGRAAVHQEVQIHEVPQRDIEYAVPLNLGCALKDLWLNPKRNYTNPSTLGDFLDAEMPDIMQLYSLGIKRP